jgi:hypothetical protein
VNEFIEELQCLAVEKLIAKLAGFVVTNAVSQGLDGNHKFVEICQTEWNSIVSHESFERSPKHRKSSKVLADALVPSSSFLGQQTLNMQVINL